MVLPTDWTVIAESQYVGLNETGRSKWVSVPDAVVTPSEAQEMHSDGLIFMAQKRLESGKMGLLIKAKKNG